MLISYRNSFFCSVNIAQYFYRSIKGKEVKNNGNVFKFEFIGFLLFIGTLFNMGLVFYGTNNTKNGKFLYNYLIFLF